MEDYTGEFAGQADHEIVGDAEGCECLGARNVCDRPQAQHVINLGFLLGETIRCLGLVGGLKERER